MISIQKKKDLKLGRRCDYRYREKKVTLELIVRQCRTIKISSGRPSQILMDDMIKKQPASSDASDDIHFSAK